MNEEKKIGLREIIAWEGKANDIDDVPLKVLQRAEELCYDVGLKLVIGVYKEAARERKVENGVNISPLSLRLFRAFADISASLAGYEKIILAHSPVAEYRLGTVAALLLHNAASASSPINGNTGMWGKSNRLASLALSGVPEAYRDDDWRCVYEKVMFGLYESGQIPWDEKDYRGIVDSMCVGKSKDTAGRACFLAEKVHGEGRTDEALKILHWATTDESSAPNQRERAADLFEQYKGKGE